MECGRHQSTQNNPLMAKVFTGTLLSLWDFVFPIMDLEITPNDSEEEAIEWHDFHVNACTNIHTDPGDNPWKQDVIGRLAPSHHRIGKLHRHRRVLKDFSQPINKCITTTNDNHQRRSWPWIATWAHKNQFPLLTERPTDLLCNWAPSPTPFSSNHTAMRSQWTSILSVRHFILRTDLGSSLAATAIKLHWCEGGDFWSH